MVFSKKEHLEIRKNFPLTKKYIFFNNAAIAPVSLPAMKTINAVVEDICKIGYLKLQDWSNTVNMVRKDIAALLNASPNEIAFIKNTSHGLSLVAGGLDWNPGDNVIVADQEFPANVYPWLNLKKKGVNVITVQSYNGRLVIDKFKNAVNSRTRLISVSSVEYATGFRNDLAAIGRLCRKHKILFCVDAIQSLGAAPMDVKKYKIDFLAADGHKWLVAPEGIGIFYCRQSLLNKLDLILVGWNTVRDASKYDKISFRPKLTAERFEEGSHNLLGIHGLAASIRLLLSIGIERIEQWNLYLTDLLIEGMKERSFRVLSSTIPKDRSAIVSFTSENKSKDKLLFNHFINNNIILSLRGDGIRLSPHLYNTSAETKFFFRILDSF